MIRRYCDACGCSIDDHKTYRKFTFGIHLTGDLRTRYVDANHNLVSMVDSTYEICNYCYNKIMGPAVNEFDDIRKNHDFPSILK